MSRTTTAKMSPNLLQPCQLDQGYEEDGRATNSWSQGQSRPVKARQDQICTRGTVLTWGSRLIGPCPDERKVQEAYWKEHSQGEAATVEAMMLDSQAAQLDKEERPEILGMLPPIGGKRLVELGSGIGRFTGALAEEADHVTAVDFIEALVAKNREANGKYPNVDLRCADVMSSEVNFSARSVDLVFSNWLLMYLSDAEVNELGRKIMAWLQPRGHLFFRESCFHQSGDHKRKTNPTHYREPMFYTKAFKELQFQEEDGSWWVLELLQCRCVSTYVRLKKNQNQVCWLWQKVPAAMAEGGTRPRSLDDGQYTSTGILRYERIFGDGYVSTGGAETTRELVAKLDLQPGQRVLDVGSGLGGGDLYMAETFDVHVVGIDLSVNMISLALERAIGSSCAVEYELADCTTKKYPEGSFDVVYSRDTILHIHDKPALFREMLRWLKPGGRLLITDYCCGERGSEASPDFAAYVAKRGYDLHTVDGYGQLLSEAGFVDVVAEDRTDQFIAILKDECQRTEADKETFIDDFSQKDYDDIVEGWKAKLVRCGKGEQKWGLFMGKKALM